MKIAKCLIRNIPVLFTSLREPCCTPAMLTRITRNYLPGHLIDYRGIASVKSFSKEIPMQKINSHVEIKKQQLHLNSLSYQLKKRPVKKKRTDEDELKAEGFFNVTAYTTAEEYDLEGILEAIQEQDLYEPKKFFSTDNLGVEQDVLYVTAKYPIGTEARDIFFFREGSVILWNCNELESSNVLGFIKKYEKDRYWISLIKGESEVMPYTYLEDDEAAQFSKGKFYLNEKEDNFLQKYTFSNALSASVKLGVWEAILERYIDSLEYITQDLKRGRRIKMSRADLLRKTGELFALRHSMNLSSDLLDTPDFYWDREELENLYLQICNYFSISRRTKVMNEKLNHCLELAELVSSHLQDTHHVRLEWMIIILIMVEVLFEILHYAERYYSSDNLENQQISNNSAGNAVPNFVRSLKT